MTSDRRRLFAECSVAALGLALLSTPAAAQLTDLQPGRNFPTATAALGFDKTATVDLADADHDGDLDVAIGNGLDTGAQLNRIHINQGGFQAGVEGTFLDETATRFAGFPSDSTRDVEFVDYDGDGDLDLFFANLGNPINQGEVSRAHTNQGGMQLGAIAHYVEATNDFWGDLTAVPASQQVFGGDHGPFRDFSCDCSFGDMDLDGDPDLFHSSYGPSLFGNRDSRVFLNDGGGTFNELWPWADVAADTKMHTLDVEIADLDGDFDLDIFASSRDSQPRIFRNDLDVDTASWPGDAFTDVTQSALLDQGIVSNSFNYEVELADLDGDGDLDAWMDNHVGFTDRLLINDGGLTFELPGGLIAGDPAIDEEEGDFVDYDSDGDLDLFTANFAGTNQLYQNGLHDGWPGPSFALLHRTGTGGSALAPWPETPELDNSGSTLAGESGDVDGDGDPDLILGNKSNQQNRIWFNELGVPDTHAPSIHLLTSQADKTDGSDTPIRVQLRDNSPLRTVNRYDVDLVYSVDGGLPVRVPMRSQRGMQFQATIPGGLHGTIAWHVEGRDDAGNAFVSATDTYVQTSSGVTLIEPVGSGTSGVAGHPDLLAFGDLTGGSTASLSLRDGAANAAALLFLSVASTPLPFKGGWLHTLPVGAAIPLTTDAAGSVWIDLPWPAGLPAGAMLWWQCAVADVSATGGASLSNAVKFTTP